MILTTPADRIREFFTLREAEKEARALPEDERSTLARRLALAFQKRDAAETLWPRGSRAEALKLARASLDEVRGAIEALAVDTRPSQVVRAGALVEKAQQDAAGLVVPELEDEARPDDEQVFRVLCDAVSSVQTTIGVSLDGPGQFARARFARGASAGAAALLALALLVWSTRPPGIKEARASAHNGNDLPERALDGNPKTNWGLPEGQLGWFELALAGPRSVKALRLIPYNVGYDNRVTKEVRVTAYLGDKAVKSLDFTFPDPPPATRPPGVNPMWITVPLDAPRCDRVRIDVKTFSGLAGSISEIEIP